MLPAGVAVFVLFAADVPTRPAGEPANARELWNAWRWYALPVALPGSTLVHWIDVAVTSSIDGVSAPIAERRTPRIGLLVRPPSRRAPALVRYGCQEWEEHRPSRLQPVAPTHARVADLDRASYDWSAEDYFAFAVDAHHLGWHPLAEAAFRRGCQRARLGEYPPDVVTLRTHAITTLRAFAWREARDALTDPDTNWKSLHAQLRRVHDDDAAFRTENNADLLRDIEAALCRGKAAPGTIEALIDGLCDHWTAGRGWPFVVAVPARTDAYGHLAALGFDSVSALLEHIDDTRATRLGRLFGINNGSRVEVGRVGDVCRNLIGALSDGEVPTTDETPAAEVRDKARAWLAKVRAVGEEQWAVTHALPKPNIAGPRPELLRLVREKFPNRLPELYRTWLVKYPTWSTTAITNEIVRSRLPRPTILALLSEGTACAEYGCRMDAVLALESFDRTEFRRELTSLFDALAGGRWASHDDGGELLRIATRADDPACWSALARFARSGRVRTRFEVLEAAHSLARTQRPIAVRGWELITASLGDAAVGDTATDMQHGYPYPCREYPKLAVRDAAALLLADLLDIDIPWRPDRSAGEWAAVRTRVAFALAGRPR